jgi:hypothetical protein
MMDAPPARCSRSATQVGAGGGAAVPEALRCRRCGRSPFPAPSRVTAGRCSCCAGLEGGGKAAGVASGIAVLPCTQFSTLPALRRHHSWASSWSSRTSHPPTPIHPAPLHSRPEDLGHKLLNNPVIWIGMEREWEIGTQASCSARHPQCCWRPPPPAALPPSPRAAAPGELSAPGMVYLVLPPTCSP